MIENPQNAYSVMNRPEVLMRLFHPRPAYGLHEKSANTSEVMIPVEDNVIVGGCFHFIGKTAPNILFFHGNGEIVDDYNDLGHVYNRIGINFLVVDYRGYGRSTGRPTVTGMMEDCRTIFKFTKLWLDKNGYTGPFIVMGRSLGSASALELASHHKDRIDGLIIESGFAYTGPLLELLGVNKSAIGFSEENGFRNLEKIKAWDKPALVIHAEFDQIIPFSDGLALYEACPSSDKTLLMIQGANHNDIFMRGLDEYMKAIEVLIEKLGQSLDF